MAATKTTTSGSSDGPSDFRPLVKRKVRSLFAGSTTIQVTKKGGSFKAQLLEDGIEVNNLGSEPFLPWEAFFEAVKVVIEYGDGTPKGNAMGPRLGDPKLPFNSVEGSVAHKVYGRKRGQAFFRRITPLARILQAAGVLKDGRGRVSLTDEFKQQRVATLRRQSAPAKPRGSRKKRQAKKRSPQPMFLGQNRISGIQ